MRRAIITILSLTVLMFAAGSVFASAPNPSHRVTICHARPADTARQGWVQITPDVASVGYQHSGHQDQHDADIIPPYSYVRADGSTFVYGGKNLSRTFDGVKGRDILANGCRIPEATPTPTPTPSSSIDVPATATPTPVPSQPVVPPVPSVPDTAMNPDMRLGPMLLDQQFADAAVWFGFFLLGFAIGYRAKPMNKKEAE